MNEREKPWWQKKPEWSKIATLLMIALGAAAAWRCFGLMELAITSGFEATAAWLTGAVAMSQAVMIAGHSGYMALCKVDHTTGGITFEAAKATNFQSAADVQIHSGHKDHPFPVWYMRKEGCCQYFIITRRYYERLYCVSGRHGVHPAC